MMNKKEIGRYLAKLRKEHKLTQKQVALKMGVESYMIHNWETGILPSAYLLSELASLYGVSIDDVLECSTPLSNKDLYKKYPGFTPRPSYGEEFNPGLYSNYQNDVLRANIKFKELTLAYRKRLLSRNENIEFEFLFNNLCQLSQFYFDTYGKDGGDEFTKFLNVLNRYKGYKSKSYYFEIRKFIDFFPTTRIQLPYPMYGDFEYDSSKGERFKVLENWEKDMFLARFQTDCNIWSSSRIASELERYEQIYGKEYDEEEAIKKAMKYCIEHGACLNQRFLSFIIVEKQEYDILSTLEEWYLVYKKPIFIYYYSPDDQECSEPKYAYVGQSEYTRFLRDYYDYSGIRFGLGLTPKELYDFLNINSEEEIISKLSERLKLKDSGKKYSRLKADLAIYLDGFNRDQKIFMQGRSDYKEYLEKNDELKNKLLNGETKYYSYVKSDLAYAGGFDHFVLMNAWKFNITYEDFLGYRDVKKTKELLEKIDSLSLDEIRKKYFPKKEIVYDD